MKRLEPSLVIPWLLTIAAAIVGILQFSQEQRQTNRRPFLEKQLEMAFAASDAAAILATETDPVEWEKSRKLFWKLYWGPLGIVEDKAVERAMVELGKIVPSEPQAAPTLPMRELEDPSLRLAHQVRNLVLRSWDVKLPELDGQK